MAALLRPLSRLPCWCGLGHGPDLRLHSSRWIVRISVALAAAGAISVPGSLGAQAGEERAPSASGVEAVLAELEPEIRRAMAEGRIPSLTIALTAGEEILWSGAYGESNLRARTPATPETVYIIASTLKTMVATVLLQLHEEGHFELDDPVSHHLKRIRIPGEDPSRPVTFHHLLTHTSGLAGGFSGTPVWADTVPTPMDEFLAGSLRLEGPPDEEVRYSNPAFTLMAHLIEEMTGGDFRDEIRSRIFDPLAMTSTDFAPTPVMEELLAVPYRPDPDTGAQTPISRVRFAEWPAGGAWGTVLDQARWLMASLNGGALGDVRLLSEETAALMHTRQSDRFTGPMTGGWGGAEAGYGLAWWTTTRDGDRYIAHSGSVGGYTAFIHGNLDRRLGVTLLTNGQRAHPHLVRLSFLATDLMSRELLP
jgi:CubicO group peptidase (beta-lactamase class C family)